VADRATVAEVARHVDLAILDLVEDDDRASLHR